jgi:hypothetical protein
MQKVASECGVGFVPVGEWKSNGGSEIENWCLTRASNEELKEGLSKEM